MASLIERVKNWGRGGPEASHVEAIGGVRPDTDTMLSTTEAARFIMANFQMEDGTPFSEAFTQADIELALDDRGWLVGGKRMAGELDPMSRQVQVNRSRYYWLRDPLVKQAVRLWTDYALGAEAMSWTVPDEKSDPKQAKPGAEEDANEAIDDKPTDKDQSDKNPTQAKLDKFMHDRRNRRFCSRQGQRRLSNKLLIDGELFYAFFDDDTVRTFDCLQITDILTDPDDEERVLGYKRITGAATSNPKTLYYKDWTNEDGDDVVSGEQQPYYGAQTKSETVKWEDGVVIYHLAFDPLEKRGTTLVSACSDWAREHRRFMTARVAIQQALMKFAFKGTVKGGQKAVDSIRSKMESTYAQTGLSGGTEHQPPNAPGGTWLQNEGVNLEAMPRPTGATDAKEDGNQLKLMVSAGTGIMLHYFGDPSTGNLATATAMELPMLKMFESYQQLWKDAWREMFSILLGQDVEDDDLVIQMPEIIEDDLQKLAAFLTSLTGMFPEAKVPSVLRAALVAMGVRDIDEVMKEIADNKETQDQVNAQNREDMLAGKGVATDPKTGKPIIVPPAVGGSNPAQDQSESIKRLIAGLQKLSEAMDFKQHRNVTVVEAPQIKVVVPESKGMKRSGTAKRNEKTGEIEITVEETSNGK